ncbi:UNVERIFIED_CONTAM: Retrovirus-related Pol polyprotein from transposon TNT 1-94 [Sesamum angustifolium]|uniref:Retrovirus-related Pol polyprotein from transposon TNT 1-94 n=1 Tax=Sesamum angustifolium TaxID=2727405 RepID=A0AAW2LG51_9LAMI
MSWTGKYNTEEQGLEKYSVSKFMRYQMVEDRSVAEQTHEIINLEHALADAEMKLPEKFLVMSIVDKFPKSWENFGMTLKHQKGRLSLDDLMIAISIEEEHRNQTHKMPVEHQPRANLIVGKQRVNKINSNSKAINKGKTTKNKKPKANKPCWNCGQVGHWAKLCPNKKAKTGQAVVNMVVGGSSGASTSGATEGYVSVQPELLTIYEPCDWLIDTGANVHVCADKSLFVSYQAITGKTVSMGNSSTAKVLGIGSVDLKFPSGRILSLKRVHHVPTVRRNIISGSVIVREGYELAFKFNKVVIQQFGILLETKPQILSSVGVPSKSAGPRTQTKEIGPKTVDAVFLGYVETSYALRFLVIKSEIPGIEVNTIVEFRDAVFLEDVFPMKTGIPSSVSLDDSLASTSIPEHVEKMTNVGVNPNSASLTHEESDIPRRSKRARVVKDFGSDFVTYNIEDDPVTFKDAMASLEAKQWKEAVKSEMDSIVSNGTWMDVKTAFLYGELGGKYMDQPEGFVAHGNERKVCKLVKSLYGLKQAPKQWHEKFDQTILAFGFTVNENDKCIYCKVKGDRIIILCLYMGEAALGHSISTDGIAISQSHYVEKILEKFGYQNSRIAKTPYDSSVALFKNESGVSVAQLRFPAVLEGYSDASWIAKNSGSNGCSGRVMCVGYDWYRGRMAIWLLSQLPIVSQPLNLLLYIVIVKPQLQRVIGIDFVGTKDNVADPLTKGLDLSQVNKSRLGMGLKTHQ